MPATTPPEDTVEVPLLVNDFLRRAAKLYPNKTAIVDGDDRFTYGQFQERVNQLGHALLSLGIQKGDRVCILSPNSHYFMESYYAVTQIGAILVPLNYRLVAADHEYIINHAGVKAVLVDYEYTKVVDDIRPNMPKVTAGPTGTASLATSRRQRRLSSSRTRTTRPRSTTPPAPPPAPRA
jgi:fatty-acyl-CoA synthase